MGLAGASISGVSMDQKRQEQKKHNANTVSSYGYDAFEQEGKNQEQKPFDPNFVNTLAAKPRGYLPSQAFNTGIVVSSFGTTSDYGQTQQEAGPRPLNNHERAAKGEFKTHHVIGVPTNRVVAEDVNKVSPTEVAVRSSANVKEQVDARAANREYAMRARHQSNVF